MDMETVEHEPTFGSPNPFTFGEPEPATFGEPTEEDVQEDEIHRLEDAYAATLLRPNGETRQISDIFAVDPTREHTALSDWQLTIPALENLDEWLHSRMVLTFDERIIYRGKFESIDYSQTELAVTISGRGAGADLDSGSYEVRFTNVEDWRAIRRVWEELTDFDVYVVRPQRSVSIDEFEAEGSPIEILQEIHQDYGYRFVIDQRHENQATSFKPGRVVRQTSWDTLNENRTRSTEGYHNKVTVVGALREGEEGNGTGRYRATAQDDSEIERMSEMGIDEPITWHERDRSLESKQECQNRADTLLEELTNEDEMSGTIDVFPRLIDPGPSYTVEEWDDDRVIGPFSLRFDGEDRVTLPESALDRIQENGALTGWTRPGTEESAPDGYLFSGYSLEASQYLAVASHGDGWVRPIPNVEIYAGELPTGEWSLIHVDWEYDEDLDETTVRAGIEGEINEETTITGTIALPAAPAIGEAHVGYIDDFRFFREPLDPSEYGELAERNDIPARYLAGRWPFDESSARGGSTVFDVVGESHGTNEGAEYAGNPRTLESLSYSESDGSAGCTLNFERVPSIAADIEALRRKTTKIEKQL